MRLLKIFQFVIILFAVLINSDVILQDYGNGNKGAGINDQVKGKDNIWIGDSNKIDGNVNRVIGDQNRIKGSNNFVQGSGNVVGDLSPQQLSKLQNQMFATFQNRFKGMFDFNLRKPSPQKQTQKKDSQNSAQKTKNTKQKIVPQPKKQAQAPEKQKSKIKAVPIKSKAKAKINSKPVIQDQLSLVFRSFGKSYQQLLQEQIYNLSQSINQSIQEKLCSRWNYCLHKHTSDRSFFSSAYPSFNLD